MIIRLLMSSIGLSIMVSLLAFMGWVSENDLFPTGWSNTKIFPLAAFIVIGGIFLFVMGLSLFCVGISNEPWEEKGNLNDPNGVKE